MPTPAIDLYLPVSTPDPTKIILQLVAVSRTVDGAISALAIDY